MTNDGRKRYVKKFKTIFIYKIEPNLRNFVRQEKINKNLLKRNLAVFF